MKICPQCRQLPTDVRLVSCERCHVPFIDAADVPLRLSEEDVKEVAKHLAKSPRFWVPFFIVLLVACFGIWKGVGHMGKEEAKTLFNQEMTNQIRQQFQEPRISNIVVAAASCEASNLMKEAVLPQITKFEGTLAQIQDEIPTNLFSRMCFEAIAGTDTNHVFMHQLTNGALKVVLKLQHVPIPQSIQGSAGVSQAVPVPLPTPLLTFENLVLDYMGPGWPMPNVTFNLQYVKNTRDTNLAQRVEFRGNEVFVDGKHIPLRDSNEEP